MNNVVAFLLGVLTTSIILKIKEVVNKKIKINIDEAADRTRKTPANFFN